MERRRRWVWIAAACIAPVVLALGVQAILVLTAPPMEPLRVDPLKPCAAPQPARDDKYALALAHAPWIYQEVDYELGRQDLPAPFDFDGDWRADNNWENFPYFELRPTVYYTVVETETHAFITYHIFHPRDWAPAMVGMHETHENDGENLQVVVDLRDAAPLLLLTQAHYRAQVRASAVGAARLGLQGLVEQVEWLHPWIGIRVESGGHGIYPYSAGLSEGMILFRPRETAAEPRAGARPGFATGYVLESLPAKLGRGALRGEFTGDGKLFDGEVRYRDDVFDLMVPRYWDGNRYSGPFGNDRGISPFALDFGFAPGEVGALYLNPAKRYREMLTITGEWSTTYTYHPWRDGGR